MVDVTVLIGLLEEYRSALQRQSAKVADHHDRLGRSFAGLRGAYDGQAAREFMTTWTRTDAQLQEYADRVPALLAVLDERISALRELDRGLG